MWPSAVFHLHVWKKKCQKLLSLCDHWIWFLTFVQMSTVLKEATDQYFRGASTLLVFALMSEWNWRLPQWQKQLPQLNSGGVKRYMAASWLQCFAGSS